MQTDVLWSDIQTAGGLNNTADNRQAFVRAVNSVTHDLNILLGTSEADIEDIDDVDCETYADNAYFSGVKYYLQLRKVWAQDPDPEAAALYRADKAQASAGKIQAAISAGTFKTRNQPPGED